MIDRKTRGKIIKLWNEGESKASIQKKTGVSQPTIRKIVREEGLEKKPSPNHVAPPPPALNDMEKRLKSVEETLIRHEKWWAEVPTSGKFIINFTKNWPYGNNTVLECLRNGVPIFDLERLLIKILPPRCVRFILDEIERLGGPGKVMEGRMYEVFISQGKWGIEDITVQPFSIPDMRLQ